MTAATATEACLSMLWLLSPLLRCTGAASGEASGTGTGAGAGTACSCQLVWKGNPSPRPDLKPFMVACWPHLFRALSSCRLAVIMASQSQLQPLHCGKRRLISAQYFLEDPKEFANFSQATKNYQEGNNYPCCV